MLCYCHNYLSFPYSVRQCQLECVSNSKSFALVTICQVTCVTSSTRRNFWASERDINPNHTPYLNWNTTPEKKTQICSPLTVFEFTNPKSIQKYRFQSRSPQLFSVRLDTPSCSMKLEWPVTLYLESGWKEHERFHFRCEWTDPGRTLIQYKV